MNDRTHRTRRRLRGLSLGVAVVLLAGGAAGQDHRGWDAVLHTYVDDDGRVAYRRLQAERANEFDPYLRTLAAAVPDDWPVREQLAFWINAYNAVIVAGVLDGHTAESLWARVRFFKLYRRPIAGQERSAEDIEHRVIRPRFRDPRAHFALVCASSSCPVLRRDAYTGARLDAQLDDQARRFLHDARRNRIDLDTGTVAVSAIFKWFAEDFGGDETALAAALRAYLSPEETTLLARRPIRVLAYDWTLNAQPGQRP